MPQPNAQHERAIAEIVNRLLSHYPTADEPFAVRQAIAADWLEDLSEFTVAQVQWAASEWRRSWASRPTIAEIRKLAIEAQREGRDQAALENKNREQDGGTWEPWLYDLWGPASTGRVARQEAIAAQEERYRRAQAYRAGKLDEYDAIHWPGRLTERIRWGRTAPPLSARDLGVSSVEQSAAPRSPFASYPHEPS